MQDTQDTQETQASTQVSHESQSEQQNNTVEVPVADSGSVSTPSNDNRKVSRKDIELVSLSVLPTCGLSLLWFPKEFYVASFLKASLYINMKCFCFAGPEFDRKMSAVIYEQR